MTDQMTDQPPLTTSDADVPAEAPDVAVTTAEPPAPPLTVPSRPGPANPSPDGIRLAFIQPDEAGTPRLWLVPIAGGPPEAMALGEDVRLVEDDPAQGPQWSPDGTRLAVVAGGPGGTAIWLIDVADGRAQPYRDPARVISDRSPRWGQDGERLAFISRRSGRDVLMVAPVGGGLARQLTDGRRDVREVVWSPDGERLAFIERSPDDEQASGYRDDIASLRLATGEVKKLTTKPSPGRRSLNWASHRGLIAFVSDEREWSHILVVNPDNASSWTMAGETGDKEEPRWSAGGKLAYTRTEGGRVRTCVRQANAARGEAVDDESGVAFAPRWLPSPSIGVPPPSDIDDAGEPDDQVAGETSDETADETAIQATTPATAAIPERLVYAVGGPNREYRFVVQDATPDGERTEVAAATPWSTDRALVTPTNLEFPGGAGAKLAGLIYRRAELAGPTPGVILIDDLPFEHRSMVVRPPEQALAASGLTVFAPHLSGARGLGQKVAGALRLGADAETEVGDVAAAVDALAALPDILPDRLAVVGQGYGGTLALLLVGGRPGLAHAAVAIDPIADWDEALDQAPDAWREWVVGQLGLPGAHRGRYAVRTPATFAGPIDVPLLLLGTASAPAWRRAQLESVAGTLSDAGVAFEIERMEDDDDSAPFRRAAAFLRETFMTSQPDETRLPDGVEVDRAAARPHDAERVDDV